jgi:hypothetical protein
MYFSYESFVRVLWRNLDFLTVGSLKALVFILLCQCIFMLLQTKKKPTGEEWVKLEESPNYKNGNKLRAYQLEGLNWLLFSWYNG